MKQYLIILLNILFVISCVKHEKSKDSSSTNNDASIKCKGTFSGKIKNDNIVLELNKDEFQMKVNGKKIQGKINEMNDGSLIKLLPENEYIPYSEFKMPDENTLQLITTKGDSVIESNDYFLDREDVN